MKQFLRQSIWLVPRGALPGQQSWKKERQTFPDTVHVCSCLGWNSKMFLWWFLPVLPIIRQSVPDVGYHLSQLTFEQWDAYYIEHPQIWKWWEKLTLQGTGQVGARHGSYCSCLSTCHGWCIRAWRSWGVLAVTWEPDSKYGKWMGWRGQYNQVHFSFQS